MSVGENLKAVWAGWSDIFVGKEDFAGHFDLSAQGVRAAGAFYLVVALVLAALQTMLSGFASPAMAALQFVSFLTPAASLYLVTHAARLAGIMDAEPARLLVPGLYMHATVLVAATVLAFTGFNLSGVVLGVTTYFLYCLGRIAGRMVLGRAIGYAIVNILVLAGLTAALYTASASLFPAA